MLGFYEDIGISSDVYDKVESPVFCDWDEQLDLPLCINKQEEAELLAVPPCAVRTGDTIAELQDGQKICAPIDGHFSEIVNVKLPRLGKLPCARILPLGKPLPERLDESCDINPESYSSEQISDAVKDSAIVDSFSGRRLRDVLDGLPENAVLCAAAFDDEPLLCSSGALFRLYHEEILNGLHLCSKLCGDKEMAVAISRGVLSGHFDIPGGITVIEAPKKYPAAEAIAAKTRRDDLVFIGVHALFALCRALASGRPQTGEYITVWGDKQLPVTVYARFGTPIYAVCEAAGLEGEVDRVISGGANGIDRRAAAYARDNGLELMEFLPNYQLYGRLAPLQRNDKIISAADMILAIWDGRSTGTKYVIDKCIRDNKKVEVIMINKRP